MLGELATLPLRVGVGATRLWLRGVGRAVAVAANATEQVVDAVVGRTSVQGPNPRDLAPPAEVWSSTEVLPPERWSYREPPPEPRSYREPPPEPRSYREPPREARPRKPEPPQRPPEPEPPQDPPARPVTTEVLGGPAHVSEEPTLVDEFAELGAEDGAGAEVHVQEPWRGYREMNAKQVIERLAEASPAELAAVQLYESRHRSRQKILTAVGSQLQKANSRGQG
jgi:hypothetical protein